MSTTAKRKSLAVFNGTSLGDLTDRINEEHRACRESVESALDHALAAGDLLIEAKALCCHGEWQDWLKNNFEGSDTLARSYMRIARNREVVESKRQRSAVFDDVELSIDKALRHLAPPQVIERVSPPPPPPITKRPGYQAVDRWLPDVACFLTRIVNEHGDWGKLAKEEAWTKDQKIRVCDSLAGLRRDLAKCEKELKVPTTRRQGR